METLLTSAGSLQELKTNIQDHRLTSNLQGIGN